MQDSFITIFNKIEQYKNRGSFEGWMKRITINTALQKYRANAPLQIVREDQIIEEDINTETTNEIKTDYLLSIIQELPDRYRLVFNLYSMDNFSHKEIAEMLHISEGTSKSNLSRARQILKQKILQYQKLHQA